MRAAAIAKPRAQRRALDAYDTPEPLARAICARPAELLPAPRSILEPCAGSGVFLRAAQERWPSAICLGLDVAPRAGGIIRGDFFGWEGPARQLLVTNCPFLGAERFVRHGLEVIEHRGHAAFLLPLSFLASAERAALYREHPLRWLLPIAGRPSFDGKGTGSQEYGVFCWEKGHRGPGEVLAPLEWRAPKRGGAS